MVLASEMLSFYGSINRKYERPYPFFGWGISVIQILFGLNECCKQPLGMRAQGRNTGIVGDKASRMSEARLGRTWNASPKENGS